VRVAFVPRHLTFHRADVIEPCLDLDDHEGSRAWLESHQIDPPVRASGDRLQLPTRKPRRSTEPTVDMPRAAGVDEIAMPPFVDDRRMPDELQIDAEPIRDSPGQVERSVGLLRLDLGEV
jgi:hypothetical protein